MYATISGNLFVPSERNAMHPYRQGCPNLGRLHFIRWLLMSLALSTELIRASLLVFSILRLLLGLL